MKVLWPQHYWGEDCEPELSGLGRGIEVEFVSRFTNVSDEQWRSADVVVGPSPPLQYLDLLERCRLYVKPAVGFDDVDLQAWGRRGIPVCNTPDYGTREVADHAMALALTLAKSIAFHDEALRADPRGNWRPALNPFGQRLADCTFGIVGLGRIGTAAALRAKAFQFRVVAYDPYMPNGTELGVGVERVNSLEALMEQTDTLSVHAPLTLETRGMISRAMLERMPKGGVVVSTARGPIVDVDALADLLKRGHLAGVGLDVLPVEPPVDPIPELLRAYRAREPWCEGRLIITPHSAFFTPEAWDDIRLKSAETMRAAMVGPRPQNVITPEMF